MEATFCEVTGKAAIEKIFKEAEKAEKVGVAFSKDKGNVLPLFAHPSGIGRIALCYTEKKTVTIPCDMEMDFETLAGMISGGVMVFVWKYLVRPNVSFLNFYELLPAFLVSSILIILVSLATKAPSKEITDEFDLVQKKMAE